MDANRALTPWERAKALLPFVDVGPEEVFNRLLDSRAQLWLGDNCSVVTEVTDDNFLHIWLGGGDLKELLDMLPSGETFAKVMGCRGIEIAGRKGWRRVMQKYGFIPNGEVMRKYYGE